MIIYISGKITGEIGYRKKFYKAELHLKHLGHKPVNPAFIGSLVSDTLPFEPSHDTYLKIDLAILKECEGIYLLKGFEDSNGAREEHAKAVQLGLPVFFQGDEQSEAELIRRAL